MDGTPPYARIAAELRGRIERGELVPGQRVPSTREITARWGVAMATATRVLATLRHDGLVHPVPGVGTVVSERPTARPPRSPAPVPGRPAANRPAGTRPAAAEPAANRPATDRPATDRGPGGAERIVAAAIKVADAEGLAALSMRRVAAELGAAPMSLYRHVTDKDELLLQMMNTVFAQARLPDGTAADRPEGWRARLELAARTMWAGFRRHPWLASALSMTRPQMLPAALPYTEWGLAALDGLGLDLDTMFTAHLTLLNYVRGIAINLETEAEAEAATGLNNEEWLDTQAPRLEFMVAVSDYPMFQRLITETYDFSLDRLFEFGLQRLLDGLATLIGDTAAPAPGGRTPPDPPTRATPAQ
jgi:AcrR family transcriptional regulator